MKVNNQNKYNRKRAKILLKGLIPSLFGIFIPKDNKRIIFNSTRNEFYNFNTKYLFEYFVEKYPQYDVKYVMNDKEKRFKLNREFGEENQYFIETESFKGMWYALRAKAWVTSAFETPVGGVFLKFNRFVYLLGHGTHFKSIVFNERNISALKKTYYRVIKHNFSYYLATSKALEKTYMRAYKCEKEQLVIAGEPRNDKMFVPDILLIHKIYGDDILKETNILYAPTWRKEGSLKLFPFDDMEWESFSSFLEQSDINIFLRMHPSFQENLEFYTSKTNRIKILDNSVVEDINDVIGIFDLLITDYSSIHIGFLLLERPVLFLPYDFADFDRSMGFIRPYNELTPGPKPATLVKFQKEIKSLLEDKTYYKKEREEVSDFFSDHKTDNCKMNAEFIIKKLLEI